VLEARTALELVRVCGRVLETVVAGRVVTPTAALLLARVVVRAAPPALELVGLAPERVGLGATVDRWVGLGFDVSRSW
jgi:hypothetical protein